MSDSGAPVYSLRYTPRAYQDIKEATMRLADLTGDHSLVARWYDGLQKAAATLATNPTRLQVQVKESQRFGKEVRRLLYQRSAGSSAAYHLYFTVEDEGDDGPIVRILHVRHAARKPITGKEAGEIRKGDA